ncbi:MAG: hypothetical protein HON42_05400 [Alphaproteobacteria bacterium]|jgi:phosphate-selective porin|nr:hypothetical protein [Alphaproteobacteria bacterium]MBT5827779.1 hypothetical protein [Alphaproteobacteria bacterium]
MFLRFFYIFLVIFASNASATNIVKPNSLKDNLSFYALFNKNYIANDQQDRSNNSNVPYARISYKKSDLALTTKINAAFKLQLDFGAKKTKLKDAYINLFFDQQSLKIGQFTAPNSIIEAASLTDYHFLTSPAVNNFLLGRNFGLNYNFSLKNFLISTAIFSADINDKVILNDFKSKILRLAKNIDFVDQQQFTLHFAGSYSEQNIETKAYQISEISASDSADLIMDNIAIDNQRNRALELAFISPKTLFIFEYVHNDLAISNAQDISFYGYYFLAAYSIFGDNFAYDITAKTYKTKNLVNSLNIAYRKSFLNLNKRAYLYGKYESDALSLNYQILKNVKLKVNYLQINTDRNSYFANNSPRILSFSTELSF